MNAAINNNNKGKYMSKYTLDGMRNFNPFHMDFDRIDKAISLLKNCDAGSVITSSESTCSHISYVKATETIRLVLDEESCESCETEISCDNEQPTFTSTYKSADPIKWVDLSIKPKAFVPAQFQVQKDVAAVEDEPEKELVDNILDKIRKASASSIGVNSIASGDILSQIRARKEAEETKIDHSISLEELRVKAGIDREMVSLKVPVQPLWNTGSSSIDIDSLYKRVMMFNTTA